MTSKVINYLVKIILTNKPYVVRLIFLFTKWLQMQWFKNVGEKYMYFIFKFQITKSYANELCQKYYF